MIGIDLVVRQDLRRRRHAEHRDIRWNGAAQRMQHVGMGDQDPRAGVGQHVVDLFRLEVPVDRHAIGTEPHRRIGRLDEGDVVAHQHADAVTRLNAELVQAAGDTVGALGDRCMIAFALAADDAEEGLGRFHLLLSDLSSG